MYTVAYVHGYIMYIVTIMVTHMMYMYLFLFMLCHREFFYFFFRQEVCFSSSGTNPQYSFTQINYTLQVHEEKREREREYLK